MSKTQTTIVIQVQPSSRDEVTAPHDDSLVTSQSDSTVTSQRVAAESPPQVVTSPNSKDWSTGLFAYEPDYTNSLDEWICWPCFSCKLAVRQGHCCLCATSLRSSVRQQYGIKGSKMEDWLLMILCGPCAVNQLYRELCIMHCAHEKQYNQSAINTSD